MPQKYDEFYGKIHILSHSIQNGYRIYNCECLNCSKQFRAYPETIRRNKNYGCTECAKKKRLEDTLKKYKEQNIGKTFGNLTILDVFRKEGEKVLFCKCKCNCGKESVARLTAVRNGQIKNCDHESLPNLEAGRKMMEELSISGTNISSLSQKISRNNKTGVKGVCVNSANGKFRAYINFRRKQYPLGEFENLEDARQARLEAEKRIYGSFEEWYSENFPETYKKTKKYFKGKEEENEKN